MTTALLDRTTRESLRSKAELVERLAERSADERFSADAKLKAPRRPAPRVVPPHRGRDPRPRQCAAPRHRGLRGSPAVHLPHAAPPRDRGRPKTTDRAGHVRLAAMRMADVARRLERRLEHAILEDPDEAARYVFEQLDAIGVTELSRLLGVSTKTVGAWRSGKPVRQKVERVKLVAQLVAYLRYSMTQTGLVMWFDNEADLLGGRSPLHLLGDSVRTAWEPLVSYARGGRGQLAG